MREGDRSATESDCAKNEIAWDKGIMENGKEAQRNRKAYTAWTFSTNAKLEKLMEQQWWDM